MLDGLGEDMDLEAKIYRAPNNRRKQGSALAAPLGKTACPKQKTWAETNSRSFTNLKLNHNIIVASTQVFNQPTEPDPTHDRQKNNSESN